MDNINISTWNVHGKGSPEEVDKTLSSHFSKPKWEKNTPHIVCVQQANLPSCGEKLQNYRWICSGKSGSAVLINKASTLKAECFEQVCEQICVAEVVTDLGLVIKVISCYIPPSTDYVTRDLWPKLVEIVKKIPVNVIYVLAGDFNAEIGKDDCSSGPRDVVGPKLCHKTSNENGMQLKKLGYNLHATITNTFGEMHSKEPFYTYKDGEGKSQRSFIMVPSDRLPYPSKILMQDCDLTWYPDYKSAVLSKSLRFTLYEKLSNFISSPVIVSCWNVQGASPAAVDKALSDLALPVACVQDVFLTSDNDIKTNNYTWFASKKLWAKNVAILIKSSSNITMDDFKVVSESLCVGDVTVNGSKVKVICCSLPSHTETVRFQEATARLLGLVKSIPEDTMFIVAGDFNTHATYTILDVALGFDESDENAAFLQKLMKESNLELPYTTKSSVTQVSEKVRRNTSFVLMSPVCMLNYSHRRIVRWVPLFENGVVTLYLPDTDVDQDRLLLTAPSSETVKNKRNKWTSGKVEHIDGFTYVTTKFCRMKRYHSVGTNEQQAYRFLPPEVVTKQKTDVKTDFPEEIVSKYKNSPPPLDELLRILGDGFTIYYGFQQQSTVPKSCANVLTASCEYMNRGAVLAECIDVLQENTKEPVKRMIKFRWNGIVLYQQEGGKFMSYKRIINKGESVFTSILGQHFFTVKARTSFYNGLLPLCQDKDELNKVLRVAKRENFPPTATVEDIKLYINDFFIGDPHYELVFGPDFSYHKFLEPIKKYVVSRNLGLRMFKSKKELENFDHISIFVNHSPKEMRRMLMLTPEHQDLRFQLIPPSGTDKDYFDWIAQWAEKVIPDEYYKPYEHLKLEPEPASGSTGIKSAKSEEESKTQSNKRSVGFVQKAVRNVGNQMQHKILRCSNLMSANVTVKLPKGRKDWVKIAREQSDLPQDLVDKYCEAPPSIQELSRILGDNFILYYGFGRESNVVSSTMDILAESFETLNRGGVMMENIEVLQKGEPCNRIVKFKWNGICIFQEEGSVSDSFRKIGFKGQAALIDKLGQNYYAVKAKMSYFNKGMVPLCQDKEKLSDVLRMVEKSEFPTMEVEQVKQFLIEFFSKDSDVELVFGPEFSRNEVLEPLRKYAMDKEVGYRLLKSTDGVTQWDSIAFFIKRTPLAVRDRLMKIPDHQDLRFFLVPPCEFFDKSHYEWIKSWTAEHFAEEHKLILEKEEKTPKPPPVKKQNEKPKQSPAPKKPNQMANRRETARAQPTRPARAQPSRPARAQPTRPARAQPTRPVRQNQQSQHQIDYLRADPWSQLSNSGQNQSVWQQDDYREEDYYRENEYSQLHRSDDYDITNWFGNQDGTSDPVRRKRDWQQMDYYGENSGVQPTASERYVPERKRAREQSLYKVEKPRWDDLAPLVMVWPINIRSEQEKDPRKVLEANFPTEVSLEANNRVAVHVTLPVRNRRDKKYCLCVGDGVYKATKTALDMIVKRSSVIKNTATFLPADGLVPNFIRYNIPCQTNPRTYILLSWLETGELTEDKIIELFGSFKYSLNEDLFFDKFYYTHDMKQMLLDLAPKHGLKVRHFGTEHRLADRYVCVYKTKPKNDILEEVLRMRDFHPKYRLVTNKLPPRLGLNIF